MISWLQHNAFVTWCRVKRAAVRLRPARPVRREDWPRSLQDPTGFYLDAIGTYDRHLPSVLRRHRRYFKQAGRGFGEDAFHALWFWLFAEFRFHDFLEIGVFRGQTLSLAALLQRELQIGGKVVGISPFTPAGDGVSRYREDVDYHDDTLANFSHFGLAPPRLIRAFSTDAEALQVITGQQWDCIYIDGGHDYDVVKSDWDHCARSVAPGGVIVLDDAAANTSFRPMFGRFKGHPGPSRVADDIGADFVEILRVGHNRVFQRVAG